MGELVACGAEAGSWGGQGEGYLGEGKSGAGGFTEQLIVFDLEDTVHYGFGKVKSSHDQNQE